ncbi:hypothetical protein LENED_012890 [Lentinula edodes]|uniref:Uncharacterized protein n=1 Tax=Lentinula edodes TaxID=5353 RepID=A0A1Q3ETW0_LENED|nr:hypothetical protein LENED_012890 [Lentinula edodes]
MSTPPTAVESTSRVVAPPMPTPPSPSHPPFATGENDIDELASTIEDPPLGHLTLFKSVFGVGVSLARYIVDDPLWPILAAAGLPCSFCVRSKKSESCSVVPHLARCSNCDDKKPCILGRLARFRYFARKCSRDLSFAQQWKIIAEKIESSTSSTRALLELSPLDDQDRLEEDHLALQDFIRRQPKLSTVTEPVPSNPPSSPVPAKASLVPKKRKRAARVDEVSSSKRTRSGEQDLGVGTAPDYRRVVLVLPPQARGRPEVVEPLTPGHGSSPHEASSVAVSWGPVPSPPRVDTSYGVRRLSWFFGQFVPPTLTATVPRDRLKSPPFPQRNREALRPYPRSQLTMSLKTENENLKSEVTELRRLLEVSRTENATLTSLLRDTSSSLDDRSKELESSRLALQEVSADRVEYQRVLTQFRAIEAELPGSSSDDVLTRFLVSQAAVGGYREVAVNQKQEIARLREQLAATDRMEKLEESVRRYRNRAHSAEGLIRQYPEDEGLYEIDLPSLSSMQDRLNESEALVRRLATFAHRLYVADPANLLHYHNTVALRMANCTLRSTSSLLYYYSNAADRVDGLYQEMFSHSRFSSDDAFLTAAQHAGPFHGFYNAGLGAYDCELRQRGTGLPHPVPSFVAPPAEEVSNPSVSVEATAPPPIPEDPPVSGTNAPIRSGTPLFLPGSPTPPSPHSPSSIPPSAPAPDVPRETIDLTGEDDDELYESREEFLVRMGEMSVVKQEPNSA